MTPLDKFGKFVTTNLRDTAIGHAEGLLAGTWKAPALRQLQEALAVLSDAQRDLVRRCVVSAIDAGVHDFLFALQVASDMASGVSSVVDGHDVASESDGLHWGPYGPDGWLTRFSAYGPPQEPA